VEVRRHVVIRTDCDLATGKSVVGTVSDIPQDDRQWLPLGQRAAAIIAVPADD
jgi:hypothetical protein